MELPQHIVKKLKIKLVSQNENQCSFEARIGYFNIVTEEFISDPEPYELWENVTPIWIFGDGTYSSEHNPTHPYTNSGEYTVLLRSNGPYKPSRPKSIFINDITSPSNAATILPPPINPELIFKSSWLPIAGGAIFYIIKVTNIQFSCSYGMSGLVKLNYPNQLKHAEFRNEKHHIGFDYEEGMSFESSETSNGSAVYSFNGISYGETRILLIKVEVTEYIGVNDYIVSNVILQKNNLLLEKKECYPIGEEIDPLKLSVETRPEDPNNKLTSERTIHVGQGAFPLHYTINFQNIKGDPAKEVIIEDMLDSSLLDVNNEIKILKSHPHIDNIEDYQEGNKLTFKFTKFGDDGLKSLEIVYKENKYEDDIEKLKEEISSTTGFITFRVYTKERYEIGDIIKNQAKITFFNNRRYESSLWTNIVETEVIPTICDENIKKSSSNFPLICFAIILVLSIVILILTFIILI